MSNKLSNGISIVLLSNEHITIRISRCYGSPSFKRRVLKTKPLRTPTMLALDYFDFYYKPLYGKRWPSTRLGLLTPHKYIAIVNRFSQSFEFNKDLLKKIGAYDLIEVITGGRKEGQLPPETEMRKERLEMELTQLARQGNKEDAPEEQITSTPSTSDEDDLNMRLEAGMKYYQPPNHEYEAHQLKKFITEEEASQKSANQFVRDRDFEVTGFEAMNIDPHVLPSVDDFITYPRELSLFVHPPKSLEGFPRPTTDKMKISSWWLVDGGSILPVLALNVQESECVLDMCAAPGGKSLLIAQLYKFSTLVSNDLKLHRIGQLKRGLEMYIPITSDVANRIIIKRKDASTMEGWDELNTYDKVLVDAPCTTDRLSANYDEGNIFSSQLIKERLGLPELQTKLLVNALRSVRVGGSVVYSTCSLSPTQNEAVVENAVVLANRYYGIKCVELSLRPLRRHLATTGLFRFRIFGLSNNFAYVVMLSAANDIIKKQESVKIRQQSAPENGSNILGDKCVEDLGEPKCWSEMSTGAILIANIIPALVIKIIFPFFMQRIPYGFRHLMVCLLQALSYIVVAFSWSIELSLFGVVLASLGSGLGESLYLGLSSHYPKNTITAWSSGTGGAGIFGALAYAALTEPHFAALTPKEALLSMLVIPFLLAVSYWSVLTIAPTVHRLELLKLRTWLAPRLNPQPVGESTSTSIPEKCNSKQSTTVGSILKEFCHKLQLTIPLLRYMIPLGVVYICEYVINSGLHQLIDYDCAHGLGLSVDSQFRWYQALYQVGVFVSRSSIGFLELPTVALYILPFLQMFLLGVFYCQAVYFYIPHIVILFILTFVEGIFGGASYANTFNQIHRKFNLSDVREFSLSICSVSDSLGITIAAFLAIAIYNHVCRLRSSSP